MAYSVGLERPFQQVNMAQIVHDCTSLLRRDYFLSRILLENTPRIFIGNRSYYFSAVAQRQRIRLIRT